MKRNKFGQSEMVGFVLIVVIVVVAAMIFLVISLRKDSGEILKSVDVENLISAVMEYTTGCAIVYEPNYESVEDLIVSCADNEICSNLDRPACDYLNETLDNLMSGLVLTESQISAYQVDVFEKEGEEKLIPTVSSGGCSGDVSKAQKLIPTSNSDIVFRIILCKSDI